MGVLSKRRFNYIDILAISFTISSINDGLYLQALAFYAVGLVVSVYAEDTWGN